VTVPRRLLTLLAALVAMAGLSACGKHQDEDAPVKHAETEGIYLDIDHLKYQVQVSRQLNPYDVQDKAYLANVPPAERALAPDETWFGVFLRVQNETARARLPAGDIKIVDTTEQVFLPLRLPPDDPFAYHPLVPIPRDSVVPLPDTPAYNTAARGGLLLFKLNNADLANRPLELNIVGRGLPRQVGKIDLDV
jgi:hypothetical protein